MANQPIFNRELLLLVKPNCKYILFIKNISLHQTLNTPPVDDEILCQIKKYQWKLKDQNILTSQNGVISIIVASNTDQASLRITKKMQI